MTEKLLTGLLNKKQNKNKQSSSATGAEVAQYTSAKLPDFLKSTLEYKDGLLGEALQQAFMGFDATLRDDEVIKELKALAGVDDDADEDDEGMEKGRIQLCGTL